MKSYYYDSKSGKLITSHQVGAMAKAGRDAAKAMNELCRTIDMLPKKKPPPLWIRRLFQ